MKSTLTLLLATLAFAGMSYAGPSDSAAFAIRNAQDNAGRNAPVQATNDSGPVQYATSPSGKGLVQVSNGDQAVTNIALTKSSDGGSCNSGACSMKR